MPTSDSDSVCVILIQMQREINFYLQRQMALGHMTNASELVKVAARSGSGRRQAVAKDHQRDGYRVQSTPVGKTKHRHRAASKSSRATKIATLHSDPIRC